MIDLQPSEDQQQIIDAVARVLPERYPLARYRRATDCEPWDAVITPDVVALGWLGLGLSEDDGGSGAGLIDEALVCREFGRHHAPLPLFAALLGARSAARSGNHALAQRIAAGECRVALALRVPALADGLPLHVIDGDQAELLVGLAGNTLYLLEARATERIETLPPMDPSAAIDRRILRDAGAAATDTGTLHWETLLLGAALLVGMAEETRDMAVAYAKQREQFGQAIGAFQAIKHMCADAALRAEAARAHVFHAGILAAGEHPALAMHCTAAKLSAAEAALQNAAVNIQVHGGMGFTAECEAHLFIKRAQVLEQFLGPQRLHQAALGRGTLPVHEAGPPAANEDDGHAKRKPIRANQEPQ